MPANPSPTTSTSSRSRATRARAGHTLGAGLAVLAIAVASGCKTGRTQLALDAPCTPDTTDCTAAAENAVCAFGVCTTDCGDHQPCAAGRVCSAAGPQGNGFCLSDCSKGQACPPGLSCAALPRSGSMGCASIDSLPSRNLNDPCDNDLQCEGLGTAIRCIFGTCAIPCGPSLPCASGQLCSAHHDGVCLVECTADRKCPEGLSCRETFLGNKLACMSPGATLPTCDSVAPGGVRVCWGMCGADGNLGVECDANHFCPFGATCESIDACSCAESQTCAGVACSADTKNCWTEPWWCRPALVATCYTSSPDLEVRCACNDGTVRTRPCGLTLTCHDICSNSCDPLAQDCPDPAAPKCAFGVDNINARCMPNPGDGAEGEPCSFPPQPPDAGANDTCGKGLKCSNGTGALCRRMCDRDEGCTSPARCFPAYPSVGYCLEPCEPWTQTCPAGMKCKFGIREGTTLQGSCWKSGKGGIGNICLTSADCSGELICNHDGGCTALCDSSHPCPMAPNKTAGTCDAFHPPDGKGSGTCVYVRAPAADAGSDATTD